jgi:uncharacterized membrane protein YqhA
VRVQKGEWLMLRNILAGSRYLVVIAILGIFLASIAVFIYGGVTVISIMLGTFTHGLFTVDGAKRLEIEAIELIDLFLLGAVLYITSLGLYELFIDDSLPMPAWLIVTSLDDLKERLIGVVIVLLAVSFLGYVVNWDNTTPILALGVAVGIVIFALAYLLSSGSHKIPLVSETRGKENHEEELPLKEKSASE